MSCRAARASSQGAFCNKPSKLALSAFSACGSSFAQILQFCARLWLKFLHSVKANSPLPAPSAIHFVRGTSPWRRGGNYEEQVYLKVAREISPLRTLRVLWFRVLFAFNIIALVPSESGATLARNDMLCPRRGQCTHTPPLVMPSSAPKELDAKSASARVAEASHRDSDGQMGQNAPLWLPVVMGSWRQLVAD